VIGAEMTEEVLEDHVAEHETDSKEIGRRGKTDK